MTSRLKLDSKQPYGERHPPEDGVFFEQDGYPFDAQGELVEEQLTPEMKARLDRADARAKADAVAQEAHRKAMDDAGFGDPTAPPVAIVNADQAKTGAEGDADVNILAWATGSQPYQFFKVQSAVKKAYGFSGTSKAAIVDYLVEEQHLLTRDQVKI